MKFSATSAVCSAGHMHADMSQARKVLGVLSCLHERLGCRSRRAGDTMMSWGSTTRPWLERSKDEEMGAEDLCRCDGSCLHMSLQHTEPMPDHYTACGLVHVLQYITLYLYDCTYLFSVGSPDPWAPLQCLPTGWHHQGTAGWLMPWGRHLLGLDAS